MTPVNKYKSTTPLGEAPVATGMSRQKTSRKKATKAPYVSGSSTVGGKDTGGLSKAAVLAGALDAGVRAGGQQAAKLDAAASPSTDLSKYGLSPEDQGYVNALTGLKYGTAIDQQKQYGKNVPGWFSDARDYLQQIQEMQGRQYQLAGQNYAQNMSTLGAGQAHVLGGGQQAAASDAASRGATASSQVGADAQAAAQIQAQQAGNYAGLIGAQGAAEGAFLANRAASTVPLEVQAQMAAAQGLQSLKRERNDYKTVAVGDVRKGNADAAAEAAKLDVALRLAGVKHSEAVQSEKTTRIKNKNDAKSDKRAAKQKAAEIAAGERENTQDNQTDLTKAELAAKQKRQENQQARQDERKQEHDESHKRVKNAVSSIVDYQARKEVPVYGDPDDPKKQTGTRYPTDAELEARLRKEIPGITKLELDRAVKRAKRKTNAEFQGTALGQTITTLYPSGQK